MTKSKPFDPDWVIHPGATLADWIQENVLGNPMLAAAHAGLNEDEIKGILAGELEIDRERALRLAEMTSVSADFWLALEKNFRDGLAAGKTWT